MYLKKGSLFSGITGCLIGIGLLVSSTSCVDQEVMLSLDELGLVDSLYLEQRGLKLLQFEDTCAAYRDLHYQVWVDSLMATRLSKIQEMINR